MSENKKNRKGKAPRKDIIYYYNMDNIINYVFNNSEDKSEPETEIMETYENEDSKLKMSSKQIREVKSSTQWNTVVSTKYDLVKTLMTMTLNLNLNDSGFGESVAINTLIKNGFIEQQEEE